MIGVPLSMAQRLLSEILGVLDMFNARLFSTYDTTVRNRSYSGVYQRFA